MTSGRVPSGGHRSRGVPSDVLRDVASVVAPGTRPVALTATRIGGGCISPAAHLDVPDGAPVFLKWSREPGLTGFGVEARGLEALRSRRALRVPEVLGFAQGEPGQRGWLALELIESGRIGPTTDERLGHGLARLHRPIPGAEPGWEEDGWIGSLPQRNRLPGSVGPSWPTFWRDARLLPQWRLASGRFESRTKRLWDRLLDRLDDALRGRENDGLSMLHGDLWSGNVLVDVSGEPVLLDPALYRGHREVDIAMMELFGGFSTAALEAYRERAPLGSGYASVRSDVYQLYPLLVHVNLFGEGYVAGVRVRVERLLAEMG